MKKTVAFLLAVVTLYACTETEGEKIVLPTSKITGEYVVNLELTQPFEASAEETIRVYNTANSADSLWVEDEAFYDSKVRVKWDGNTKFFVEEGNDIAHNEIVTISGEIFPANDSIHVEWRYHQGTGDPADDFVVFANGVLYNGLTN